MFLLLRTDQRLKQNHKERTFASSSTRTVPIGERKWTDIEPEDYSHIAHPVSKQLSTLLRHDCLPREADGAIEFWRINDFLQDHFVFSRLWSDDLLAEGGGNKKRFQYCPDSSEKFFASELFKVIQDGISLTLHNRAMIIQSHFFQYIYHVGCAINLRSIMNSGLTPGGQNLRKRTDGNLHVCGSFEQRTQIFEQY